MFAKLAQALGSRSAHVLLVQNQPGETTMRVFITGASGFIGSAIVQELLGAGHEVLALARSEPSAAALTAAGAEVVRGSLAELDVLRRAAAAADGVIHAAFNHDFSDFAAGCALDQRAIETFGAALAGSGRPLIVTSGTMTATPGRVATEEDAAAASFPRKSEESGLATARAGVRASVIRLAPTVHGDGDHGFVPALIGVAREQGVSMYPGDGANRWPAVHRLDAARLYRLALEQGASGRRYHGVAEQGIPTREIAELIARRLNVPAVSRTPEEVTRALRFVGHIFVMDGPTSSARTQEALGWRPTQPGLIEDLERGHYFER
jgi:nucleoside-diphosphate-sugar epimerase